MLKDEQLSLPRFNHKHIKKPSDRWETDRCSWECSDVSVCDIFYIQRLELAAAHLHVKLEMF